MTSADSRHENYYPAQADHRSLASKFESAIEYRFANSISVFKRRVAFMIDGPAAPPSAGHWRPRRPALALVTPHERSDRIRHYTHRSTKTGYEIQYESYGESSVQYNTKDLSIKTGREKCVKKRDDGKESESKNEHVTGKGEKGLATGNRTKIVIGNALAVRLSIESLNKFPFILRDSLWNFTKKENSAKSLPSTLTRADVRAFASTKNGWLADIGMPESCFALSAFVHAHPHKKESTMPHF
ncbi:hypothetical protein EVAR_58160_1 [Eumeta japonica]|uniref:Uncharacterized protein n=1 Tax=Eumeta variegata TaxID=151549 RepID=A0A4C1WZB2_EUMVA|nr:hypothetical protein EVAR_58160_1 [Eumeta japonica]